MALLITDPLRWVKANPAKAAQGIRRLMLGACFSCGKDQNPVENVRRSLAVSYYCCDECRLKYDEKELRDESERLMLVLRRPEWKRKMTPMLCPEHDREKLTCRFCKRNPLRQDPYTREVPLMCEDCWRGVLRLRARANPGEVRTET